MAHDQKPLALNAPAVDCNRCRSAYLVRSLRDVPSNLQVPEANDTFHSGLFLPRKDPDFFGRSSYTARAVLLFKSCLLILTHSQCKSSAVKIPLRHLLFLEVGRNARQGWLRFAEKRGNHRLPFKRHSDRAVGEFLRGFREAFLPDTGFPTIAPAEFGEAPDVKFENAERFELLPGEEVMFQFFSAANMCLTVRWILPWESWAPGNLWAVTTRRVLWITDQVEGQYDFCATVTRSAPLENLSEVRVESAGDSCVLSIKFRSEASWSVSLPIGRQTDASRFAEAVIEFRERTSSIKESSKEVLGGKLCLATKP